MTGKKKPCRITACTPPHELPYLLRVCEVAVWLGLTEESVRAAIKRGDIPARRSGGMEWQIKRNDLVAETKAKPRRP